MHVKEKNSIIKNPTRKSAITEGRGKQIYVRG